jgi:hypothetical protein
MALRLARMATRDQTTLACLLARTREQLVGRFALWKRSKAFAFVARLTASVFATRHRPAACLATRNRALVASHRAHHRVTATAQTLRKRNAWRTFALVARMLDHLLVTARSHQRARMFAQRRWRAARKRRHQRSLATSTINLVEDAFTTARATPFVTRCLARVIAAAQRSPARLTADVATLAVGGIDRAIARRRTTHCTAFVLSAR